MELDPTKLAAQKREAKRLRAIHPGPEPPAGGSGFTATDAALSAPSDGAIKADAKPTRKAKQAAKENKVWQGDRGQRKRVASIAKDKDLEAVQPKRKEARTVQSTDMMETTDTVGNGGGKVNRELAVTAQKKASQKSSDAPTTVTNTKKRGRPTAKNTRAKMGLVSLGSRALEEESDIESFANDNEKDIATHRFDGDNSDGVSSGEEEEGGEGSEHDESEDELLASLTKHPAKLRAAFAKEIPQMDPPAISDVTISAEPTAQQTPHGTKGLTVARKVASEKAKAKNASERATIITEDEAQEELRKVQEALAFAYTGGAKIEAPDGVKMDLLAVVHPSMSTELVLPVSSKSDQAISLNLKAQAPPIQALIQTVIDTFVKEIVFEKGFPLLKDKRAMVIRMFKEAANAMGLVDVEIRLSHDTKYANRLANLPEGRLATWRQNFKRTAQTYVISGYELTRNQKECKERVVSLLKFDNFIYPVNSQGNQVRYEPFQHPVILDILRATVFNGPTSLGYRHKDHFVSVLDDREDEPELPSGLVAFVATMVYSILADWRNGSGPADDTVSFVSDQYHQVYDKFQKVLRYIYTSGNEGPKKYHMLLSRMYQNIMIQTELVGNEQTMTHLDLDNMVTGDEEAARDV